MPACTQKIHVLKKAYSNGYFLPRARPLGLVAWTLAAALLMPVIPLHAADDLPPIPATPKKPVIDDYGGVKVGDDYRWLEAGADPEVKLSLIHI